MTLESKYNVPVFALHCDAFKSLVRSVTRLRGMPHARYGFVPMPVMGKTAAQLTEYIEGIDPVNGRPVWQELIEGLTVSMQPDETEVAELTFDRTGPRTVGPETEEDLQQIFLENDWTDKLPIVLPTEERVARMLAATSHKPDEVLGHMGNHFQEQWEYTVENVAVNAVMSGARPQYFPVILAMAASQQSARGTSSSSMAGMAVVNGPIRHEINMNWGIGAMGPYNHANATIGRAWGLLSQNCQGGSKPGSSYMGSQGNAYSYQSVTFPENEERSPWEPFHVEHGFKASDSTVSMFSSLWSTQFTFGLPEKHWRDHLRNMFRGIDPSNRATFVLDPLTARQFIDRGGFDTKQKLRQWVYENALMPQSEFWDYQIVKNYVLPRATAGEEPMASKWRAAPDELVHIWEPDEIQFVVVGGETNGYWRLMGSRYSRTMNIDEWR
jgi:hypothetical protein